MSKHITPAQIDQVAGVVDNPHATTVDRTFELPTGLYAGTVGAYLAFIGLMALIFHNPELALPLVIITFFIFACFGVLSIWANMNPDTRSRSLGWYDFKRKGIQTLSGRLDASSAAVQVLILPVLILVWGLAIAVIVATL